MSSKLFPVVHFLTECLRNLAVLSVLKPTIESEFQPSGQKLSKIMTVMIFLSAQRQSEFLLCKKSK